MEIPHRLKTGDLREEANPAAVPTIMAPAPHTRRIVDARQQGAHLSGSLLRKRRLKTARCWWRECML